MGIAPALIAIVFRLTIPESPRYTLDVAYDDHRALEDTQMYYGSRESVISRMSGDPVDEELEDSGEHDLFLPNDDMESIEDPQRRVSSVMNGTPIPRQRQANQFSKEDLLQYFIVEGNWRYLAGTSLCWFILDFAFYGLGINNPQVIARIWDDREISVANATEAPEWNSSLSPNAKIYDVLINDAWRSIITISTGALLGSIVLVKAINYIPRRSMLGWSFVALAILLGVTGGSFFKAFQTDLHALTITLYVLCQLLFNLGKPILFSYQQRPHNPPIETRL